MSAAVTASEEMLSGEAVAIDAQPVGFVLRALGAFIDIVVSALLLLVLIVLTTWLSAIGVLDPATERIAAVTATVVALVLLPVTVEVATHGRSLGKLAIGARIVRRDGGATGFRHAFIRALVGVLEIYLTVGAVAVLTGVFTARSQRLGDLVAGTYAQRIRVPALPTDQPTLPPALQSWAAVADVARLPDRLARRVSQFLEHAPQLSAAARARVADDLLREVAAWVSPLPDAPAEIALTGIAVVRREREARARALADARAETLSGQKLGVQAPR